MIRLLLVINLLFFGSSSYAQLRSNPFGTAKQKADIPFEYINNFIVVEVLFNNVFPLKFILDTGAEHTIVTRREITDLMQINYRKRFSVLGADLKTELIAYLASGIDLRLGEGIALRNQNVLVLEEDYFRFEEYAGIGIHGIIGADLLRFFVLEIDYRRKTLTFNNPNRVKISKKSYNEIPVSFRRYKPYLNLPVTITPGSHAHQLKLLVDTGASLAMLLHTNTDDRLEVPEAVIPTNIGMGLGGFLSGFVGRIEKIDIGNFDLPGVVSYYMDVDPHIDSSYLNQRNGILGNGVWERFNLIIDYPREKLYIKPGRKFRRVFSYDRSGLVLSASGNNLRNFVVMDVVANSPAEEAGIQVGDIIRTINRVPANFFQLSEITNKLRKKAGKKVRLSILRQQDKMRIELILKDYL